MTNLARRIPRFTVNFERTSSLRRHPCGTCGGSTDKESILPVWYDEDGDQHDMCDRCVVSSLEELRSRVLTYAQRLESWAATVRQWVQAEWHMPSIEDTAEARANDQAEWVDYHKSAGSPAPDLDAFDRDKAYRSLIEHLESLRSGQHDHQEGGES